MLFTRILTTILIFLILVNRFVYAHGECCLPKSLTEATTSDITLSQKFGLSFQYEYSNMLTIRDGRHKVSHNDVLNEAAADWPAMPDKTQRFTIPTRMIMQKYTLLGVYTVTEKFQFLTSIPYVINDMNMRTLMRDPWGMDMTMDMKMPTVEGLGDTTLMGLYTLYTNTPDQPTKKLSLGLGLKTPTGENDQKMGNGTLIHAMMQPGTGSWDPILLAHYQHTFKPILFQTNLMYQMCTEGDEGYEFGDKVALDLIARYPLNKYVSPGIELNNLYTGKDNDHNDKYSREETSLLDNTDNTGLTSVSLTPSAQVKIPGTSVSIDFKFQKPIYQNVRGTQQVLDWRATGAIVWAF